MKSLFCIFVLIGLIGCANSGRLPPAYTESAWVSSESISPTKTEYTVLSFKTANKFGHFKFTVDTASDTRDELSLKCATYSYVKIEFPELLFVSNGEIKAKAGVADGGEFYLEKNIMPEIAPLDGKIVLFEPTSAEELSGIMRASTINSIIRCN